MSLIKSKYKLNMCYTRFLSNNIQLNKFYCCNVINNIDYDQLIIQNNFDDVTYQIGTSSNFGRPTIDDLIFEKIPVLCNITGNVLNIINDNPISNVIVNFKKQNQIIYTTQTNNDGIFTINNILIGSYEIECIHKDYIQIQPYIININKKHQTVTIYCKERLYTISGHVFNQSNQPLMSTDIIISNGNIEKKTKTDPNGFFMISGFDKGMYTITASKENYKPNVKNVIITLGHDVYVTITLEERLLIYSGKVVFYNEVYFLSGTVYGVDNKIVSNCKVYIYNEQNNLLYSLKTDNNGHYSIILDKQILIDNNNKLFIYGELDKYNIMEKAELYITQINTIFDIHLESSIIEIIDITTNHESSDVIPGYHSKHWTRGPYPFDVKVCCHDNVVVDDAIEVSTGSDPYDQNKRFLYQYSSELVQSYEKGTEFCTVPAGTLFTIYIVDLAHVDKYGRGTLSILKVGQ